MNCSIPTLFLSTQTLWTTLSRFQRCWSVPHIHGKVLHLKNLYYLSLYLLSFKYFHLCCWQLGKPIWVFLLNLTNKIKQKLKEGLLYREEIGSWHRQWDWLCPLHQAGHRWLSKKERRKNKKERNGKGLGLSLTVMRWAGVLRFRLPLPGPSVCYVSPSNDFSCPGKLWWVDKSSQVWTVWQRRKLWKIYFMETDVVYFQFSTFCH